MKINPKQLKKCIDSVMENVIKTRRQLHRHPELSGAEKQTALLVAKQCRELGLTVQEGIGGYGVLAMIMIDDKRPWLAFRADMDALPIQEKSPDCSYISAVDTVSHSCGHDAHTAILLGTIQAVVQLKQFLHYNLAFVFQPAEESCKGASAMLRDGVFNHITPSYIYALHVYPYLPAGSIGLREGAMCAAADMFDVELKGHGGHAARPHECTDLILIATHIIQALHQIIGRRINPLHPAVLTIGQIHGGHAGNVLPESLFFSGTLRSLHTEVHEEIRSRMDRIIRQTAELWGATASFTLRQATPVLSNNTQAIHEATALFEAYLPDVDLIQIQEPSMGGEDFAEFLHTTPGCLFRLGTGGRPETRYPLHHPCFNLEEDSMSSGVAAFTALALQR
ncbi:MAG: amidohydrolase [Mariprofundus sp.]|nr:amidohydrolase [Mariprofundus sp.]